MAATRTPVTPERARKILSSFVSDGTKPENVKAKSTVSPDITDPESTKERISRENTNECLNLRSREAFFARVETFSPLTWFAKPDELSPLVFAQHGWENTEDDMLQCVTCKMMLCGALPSNTDQKAYKEACRKLKTSITDNHEKLCTWSTHPAPDWFAHVPHYDLEEVRRDFQERYNTLKTAAEKLPDINYTSLAKFGFDTHCCGKLTYSLDQSSEIGLKKAAALAITGWMLSLKNETLVCQHCRRLAGLWNFTVTAGPGSDDSTTDTDPPAKRQRLEVKDSFDPSDEHRTFCPWIKLKQGKTTPSKANPKASKSPQSTHPPNNGSSHNQGLNTSSSIQSPGPNTSSSIQSPGLDTSSDLDTDTESVGSSEVDDLPVATPGWLQNLKIIAPHLSGNSNNLSKRIKVSPMVVGLRSIRRLFQDWATPDTKQIS